jgi:hypothetical protein
VLSPDRPAPRRQNRGTRTRTLRHLAVRIGFPHPVATASTGRASNTISLCRWPVRDAGLASLLDLQDAESVLARVGDERRPGEPDVGDAVVGLQTGQVVFLDLDAA